MAHTCPVCGQVCYCNGDIDDIILDHDEDILNCICCDELDDYGVRDYISNDTGENY